MVVEYRHLERESMILEAVIMVCYVWNVACIHAISYVVYAMIQRSLGTKLAISKICMNLRCEQSRIESENFGKWSTKVNIVEISLRTELYQRQQWIQIGNMWMSAMDSELNHMELKKGMAEQSVGEMNLVL